MDNVAKKKNVFDCWLIGQCQANCYKKKKGFRMVNQFSLVDWNTYTGDRLRKMEGA